MGLRHCKSLLGITVLAGLTMLVGCTGVASRATNSSQALQSPSAPLNVPLDQYGGREDIKCANVTPYFHLEEINRHWYFCTPAGNGFISMNVGNVGATAGTDCNSVNIAPIFTAKYAAMGDPAGTGINWAWQTLKRMKSWYFNSVGEDSDGKAEPWYTCTMCVWPGGTQPIPLPYAVEFKPAEYAASGLGSVTNHIKDQIAGTNANYTSYRGGSFYDMFDPNLSTEWNNELNGNQPEEQNIRSNYAYSLGVFTDDQDFFIGWGPGPDFVSGHTNANSGWITLVTAPTQTYIDETRFVGSTFLYTDTKNYAKTQATNPAHGVCSLTAPCSLRDYLYDEYSASISSLNTAWGSNYTSFDSTGTQVTGESIGTGNGSTVTFTHTIAHTPISPFSVLVLVAATAKIGDCPWFTGSAYGSSNGGCTITTNNVGSLDSPTAGYVTSASTINYSTGAVTITFGAAPANGAAITVNYIYGGWMAGGTGLMDESGGTGSMAGCPGSGTSTCWVGTNPYCLEGANPSYPTYFSCTGAGESYNPVPNANANLAVDLDGWIAQGAARYFKTMHDDLRAVSNLPYLGLDQTGGWGAPAYSKVLQGAAPYTDAAFMQFQWGDPTSTGNPQIDATKFAALYKYGSQYFGDKPIWDFITLTAAADSSMSCHSVVTENDWPTQAQRGQAYYKTVSYLLSTPSFNNTYQLVAFNWWSWQDFQSQNQGLVSIHDNAYDGNEVVTASVPCDSYHTSSANCGGETTNYGDLITSVKNGNLFWLTH